MQEYIVECWPPRATGGQVVGTGPAGVRVTHIASGMQAYSGETERSQHRNKQIAMAMIEGGLTFPGYRGPLTSDPQGAPTS